VILQKMRGATIRFVCVCVCVCVCVSGVCVRERERGRERDRQAHVLAEGMSLQGQQ